MPQRLEFAAPIVSTRTSLHADQASRLLLEKCEHLPPAELAAHENPTVPVDPVDLKDALREVDANCSKLGHGWLLRSGRQHPDYGPVRSREQEPSTPSIKDRTKVVEASERILNGLNVHLGDYDADLGAAQYARVPPTVVRGTRHVIPAR